MNLIICGNGFDRHHGLKTAYCHYRKHLEDYAPRVLKDFELFPWFKLKGNDLWKDVELSLSMDETEFRKYLDSYLIPYHNGDTEALIELINNLETYTRFMNSFVGEEFYKWLSSVPTDQVDTDPLLEEILADSVCVTFNYTDTLENLYHIDPQKIYHIHGKLSDVDSSGLLSRTILPPFRTIEEIEAGIVKTVESDIHNADIIHNTIQFGYPETTDKPSFLTFTRDDNYCGSIDIDDTVQRLFLLKTKYLPFNVTRLVRFLKDNKIDKIYHLGLSINGPDDYYFEKVFSKRFRDSEWHIYYHEDTEENKQAYYDYAERYNLHNVSFHHW